MTQTPPSGELNVDFDRLTGETIWGWYAVKQAIDELILTSLGERAHREWVGSGIVGILGREITPQTILRAYTALAMVLDVFEPRFRLRRFQPAQSDIRSGRLRLRMEGDYLPRALVGDFTIALPVSYDEDAQS